MYTNLLTNYIFGAIGNCVGCHNQVISWLFSRIPNILFIELINHYKKSSLSLQPSTT
jgi:hypothetical protein